MAVTRSTASDRDRPGRVDPAGRVSRNLEFSLLLLTAILLAGGTWLILKARSPELSAAEDQIAHGKLLNVNELRSPDELLPALGFLDDPEDRNFAARRILQFLRDREHIDSVGELHAIQVTSSEIGQTRGLSAFPARLKEMRQESGEAVPTALPLLTQQQFQQLRPMLAVRSPHDFRRLVLIYVAVFVLAFLLLHAVWRFRSFAGDQLLLPPVLLLSGFGLLMMIRLRDPIREALLFPDFATGVAIGCILAFLASLPDYEHSTLRRLAYIPLLASFLLSLVLIFFGSGPGVSDARVNLRLGPILLQPVEFIKALLLLFLAGFFADRWEFLRELRAPTRTLPPLLRSLNLPRLRYAVPLVIAIGLAIAFFFLEKDLGPALVLTLLFLILYAVARSRLTGALIAFAALIAAFGIGYKLGIPHTVANRVSMWLSPWDNYISHGGDHLAQSFWSFSAGGLSGTGLGLGEPGTVPAVHTDLILAAIGEELGFLGLACIYLAYAVLVHRALRISLTSRGSYSFFLGLGMTLLIALQTAFISAGILGLAPLSGVVTPFINYGKSSAVVNFLILGVLAALSADAGRRQPAQPFRKQVLWVGRLLGILGLVIVCQAARVQILEADRLLWHGALVPQADGHRRYLYNGRILEAAQSIPRGTIYDRNGIPLATSSQALLESYRAQYDQLHVNLVQVTGVGSRRMYPFGALTFHMLGDLRSRLNWGAPNTSFVERDRNITLQGYDDRAIAVRVRDTPDGPEHLVLQRDFQELLPLVRYRYRPDDKKVREIMQRDRDVHLTLDARLQSKLAEILEKHILAAKMKRGAAVVIDPSTGDLLASATYPYAGVARAAELVSQGDPVPESSDISDSLFDRVRYGLYPPGSSFKLVTTIAALQSLEKPETITYQCKRLPDGRVGNYVRGWGRPIRDDILDTAPHGTVDLAKGLILSCNAYFAQLGTYDVGAERLLHAADLFGIKVASPNTPAQLKDALPQASYGQGQVVASPLMMARVAGSICNDGKLVPTRWVLDPTQPSSQVCLPPERAHQLSDYMRRVITEGTGKSAKGAAVPLAGKTGTAELRDKPAHAWFVGFAPYGSGTKRIAFAIIIENGRYGGRVAAPVAVDIVNAALDAGLIKRE
ncbi:MAG: FtsW/RodA/SpoVE family cell cycle protein [Acidobacteriota bacterium]